MDSDTPPPVDADALRAMLEAITPLPWSATDQGQGTYGIGWVVEAADGDIVASRVICYDGKPLGAMTAENAHFIAAAANAVPALLKERDALRAGIRAYLDACRLHEIARTDDDYDAANRAIGEAEGAFAALLSPDGEGGE